MSEISLSGTPNVPNLDPAISPSDLPWPYNLVAVLAPNPSERPSLREFCQTHSADDVREVVGTLPEPEAIIILEYYQEGLSLRQIGNRHNYSHERVRAYLARGLEHLRQPERLEWILYGEKCARWSQRLRERQEQLAAAEAALNERQRLLESRSQLVERSIAELTGRIKVARHFEELLGESYVDKSIFPYDDLGLMGLSLRTQNRLFRYGCHTVSDVVDLARKGEFILVRGFGPKSAVETLKAIKYITGLNYAARNGYDPRVVDMIDEPKATPVPMPGPEAVSASAPSSVVDDADPQA